MASKKDYDHQFKLVLIGDTGVGKSCILIRFVDDTYRTGSVSSIGVDFKWRTLKVDKKTLKLQVWDTAGQERFRTITSAYYRGADGIVIIYDVTNKDSYNRVSVWLDEVNRYASEDSCKIVVGNKIDLTDKDRVKREEAEKLAQDLGYPYIEVSAKDGTNIDEIFTILGSNLISTKLRRQSSQSSPKSSSKPPSVNLASPIDPGTPETKRKGGCC